jgi:hypothetical protein
MLYAVGELASFEYDDIRLERLTGAAENGTAVPGYERPGYCGSADGTDAMTYPKQGAGHFQFRLVGP